MTKKINLAVSGYGKMGHLLVEAIENDPGFNLACIIDRSSPQANFNCLKPESLDQTDIIIDFSSADNVLPLLKKVSKINPQVRVIIGTTGWLDQLPTVKRLVSQQRLFCLFGTNFSIGTNLFFKLVDYAAELFNHFDNFDPALLEIHHRHKKDMPSGTAKKIAQSLVNKLKRKDKVLMGMSSRAIKDNELHVASLRTGENKGIHQVSFDSLDEVISLSQQTRDRSTYIQGSLVAAKWLLKQKKPGFYSFDDCFENIIK